MLLMRVLVSICVNNRTRSTGFHSATRSYGRPQSLTPAKDCIAKKEKARSAFLQKSLLFQSSGSVSPSLAFSAVDWPLPIGGPSPYCEMVYLVTQPDLKTVECVLHNDNSPILFILTWTPLSPMHYSIRPNSSSWFSRWPLRPKNRQTDRSSQIVFLYAQARTSSFQRRSTKADLLQASSTDLNQITQCQSLLPASLLG